MVVKMRVCAVIVQDLTTQKTLRSITGKWDIPVAISVSPQGDVVGIGGQNGILTIQDLEREDARCVEVKVADGGEILVGLARDSAALNSTLGERCS